MHARQMLERQILGSEEHLSPTASNLANSCFFHNLVPDFPKNKLSVTITSEKQAIMKTGKGDLD